MKKVIWILLALLVAILLFLTLLAFIFLPQWKPQVPQANFAGPSGAPFVKGPTGPPPSAY